MCCVPRKKRKSLPKGSKSKNTDTRTATLRCARTQPRIHVKCPVCGRDAPGIRVALGGDDLGLTGSGGITAPLEGGMVAGKGDAVLTLGSPQKLRYQDPETLEITYDAGCQETFIVPLECLVRPRVKVTFQPGGAAVPGVAVTSAGKDLGATSGAGISAWPDEEPGLVPGDYPLKLAFSPADAKKYRWVEDKSASEHTVTVEDVVDPTFSYEVRRLGRPKIKVVREDSGAGVPGVGVKLKGGPDYGTTPASGLVELPPDSDWLEPGSHEVIFTLGEKNAERYVLVDADPKVTVTEGSEATTTFQVRPAATLIVEVLRYDGTKLPKRVKLTLANGGTRSLETEELVGKDPELDRDVIEDRKKITGLPAGDYTVTLTDVPGLLTDQQKGVTTEAWTLGPSKDGIAKVKLAAEEVKRVRFTLTRIKKIQFIGFAIEPTTRLGTGTTGDAYHGREDDLDIGARCVILKNAIKKAHGEGAVHGEDTVLKVFMAPEFYFRGKHGGYPIEKVSHIMDEMREETKLDKYKHWLFVHGTAIGYLDHGSGGGTTHELAVEGAPLVAATSFTIKDQVGKKDKVGVCARIPANWNLSDLLQVPQYRWTLKQGSTEAHVIKCTPGVGAYVLDVNQATLFTDGAIELIEPEATEVFNVALVQKGGPGTDVAGLREAIVYKEEISAIDFISVMYGKHDQFHQTSGDNRKIEIHGQERRVLPTEGSRDVLGGNPNTPATGGNSEVTSHGLGGGSIFNVDGITFGLEVCRDHLQGRLKRYFVGDKTVTPQIPPAASPGDPKVQVQLIPSWGAFIKPDSITGVGGVLVFNVDGPSGCKAGPVTGAVVYRCSLHGAESPEPKVCTGGPHHACYAISEATGTCKHCGKARTKSFPSGQKYCKEARHLFWAQASCNVGGCTAPTKHLTFECKLCGAKSATLINCAGSGCGARPMTERTYCDVVPHVHPTSATTCACGKPVSPKLFYYCMEHDHVQSTGGTCSVSGCGSTDLRGVTYKMRGKDITPQTAAATVDVADAPGDYRVVTAAEVVDGTSPTGKKISYTTATKTITPQQAHYFTAKGNVVIYDWMDVPEAEAL